MNLVLKVKLLPIHFRKSMSHKCETTKHKSYPTLSTFKRPATCNLQFTLSIDLVNPLCADLGQFHFNASLHFFYVLRRPKEIMNIDPLQARLIWLFFGRFRTRGLCDMQVNFHSFYNQLCLFAFGMVVTSQQIKSISAVLKKFDYARPQVALRSQFL